MSRWRDLLIDRVRDPFPRFELPPTLVVRSAHAIELDLAFHLQGLELRYVFDWASLTLRDREVHSFVLSRLRAPGARLYTMLMPDEIVAAACEPMPG